MQFKLSSEYKPSGDQPGAIDGLCSAIKDDWDGRYSYGGVISKQTDHSYDDKNPPGDKYYDPTFREKMIKEYLERYAAPDADRNAAEFVDGMKDEKNLESLKKQKKEAEKRLQQAKDKRRYRRYNDYRNSSVLAKWQNQNWMDEAVTVLRPAQMPLGVLEIVVGRGIGVFLLLIHPTGGDAVTEHLRHILHRHLAAADEGRSVLAPAVVDPIFKMVAVAALVVEP